MANSSATGAVCTATDRAMPTISAPMAAPSMLPSPPMITTANDRMITPTDTPGCTEIIGAVKAPPSAARKMPMENATMYTRETFTPMLAATSGLWITASTILPWRVRFSPYQTARPTVTARPTSMKS